MPYLQVEALQSTMAQHQALREIAGPSKDAAMVAAYRGFLHLLAAEEERATTHRMVSTNCANLQSWPAHMPAGHFVRTA